MFTMMENVGFGRWELISKFLCGECGFTIHQRKKVILNKKTDELMIFNRYKGIEVAVLVSDMEEPNEQQSPQA